jgi:hypothetical protein
VSRARLEAEDPSNGLHEAVTWAERQGKLVFSDDAKDDDRPTHSVAFLHEPPEDANNDLVRGARYLSEGGEEGRGRGGARGGSEKILAKGLRLDWCMRVRVLCCMCVVLCSRAAACGRRVWGSGSWWSGAVMGLPTASSMRSTW